MDVTEEKLKAYILTQYKSLRDFAQNSGVGIPYTTIDGILKRGVRNSSISNVIKLCSTLNISADELAKGMIVPLSEDDPIQLYAQKLVQLTPTNLKSALQYIDYLIDSQGGKL